MSSSSALDRQRHMGYFAHCLRQLPAAYGKLDTNRLTLAHFCVHALDLLGVWGDRSDGGNNSDNDSLAVALGLDRRGIIEWIYSLQVVTANENKEAHVGFKGGSFLGGGPLATPTHTAPTDPWHTWNQGHIAMTYTALCTLRTLGDDLSRVDKAGIIRALPHLQLADGSFQCVPTGSEHDMRFLYCACCISHMLQDWSGVDQDRAIAYIQSCRSFDGAVALLPGNEGHGGSTFCAIASLTLMGRLDEILDADWRNELTHWCVQRQIGGFQGRPNKLEDTCYSYWIGGTLHLLGRFDLLDHEKLRSYVMKCQTRMGGFSKVLGAYPDVLHAYYSMAYLSLSHDCVDVKPEDTLKELDCTLGIGKASALSFFQ